MCSEHPFEACYGPCACKGKPSVIARLPDTVWKRKSDGVLVEVTKVSTNHVMYINALQQYMRNLFGAVPLNSWHKWYTRVPRKTEEALKVTPTGRIARGHPEVQELPKTGYLGVVEGSAWKHRRNGCRINVDYVDRTGPVIVVYVSAMDGNGHTSYPMSKFLELYDPIKLVSMISLDFSAIEARVEKILDGSMDGKSKNVFDVHKLRAAEIFDVKPSEVTPVMRRVGKAANLVSMYRGGNNG
jgi:hypothetical protein